MLNEIGTVAKFNPLVYNIYSRRMTKLIHLGNLIQKELIWCYQELE